MKQLGMFGEDYAPARNDEAPEAKKKPPMPEEQLQLFFKGTKNDVEQTFICDPATGEVDDPLRHYDALPDALQVVARTLATRGSERKKALDANDYEAARALEENWSHDVATLADAAGLGDSTTRLMLLNLQFAIDDGKVAREEPEPTTRSLSMETWKTIPDFPDYEVSDLGRVRSIDRYRHDEGGRNGGKRKRLIRGTVLSPANCDGYPTVSLTVDSKGYTRAVHRLVLEAFVGARPEGQECRHLDGDRSNACLCNLKWDSPAANQADRILHGTSNRGEQHPLSKLTDDQVQEIRSSKETDSELAKRLSVSRSCVQAVRTGKRWSWSHTEQNEVSHRCSYAPEDNKLRFYPDWDDPDFDKEDLKAAGYRWASKQECYVCPRWTCTAEDAALDYVLEIEDENYSPAERAADRAERFAGYRDKRRQGAHDYADRMGESVAGFQDQRKADRAARKRDRLAGHAITQWDRAEYWQSRTAGVIDHALYREQPDVRRRRIKTLESEQRKHLANLEHRAERLASWKRVAEMEGADVLLPLGEDGYVDNVELNEAGKLAYRLANCGSSNVILRHPRDEGANEYAAKLHGKYHYGFTTYDLMTKEHHGAYKGIERLTPKEVAEIYLREIADPDDEDGNGQRWKRHYENRLAYEYAMMENEGGNARDCDMVPGGWIYLPGCRSARFMRGENREKLGWVQIQKVNKSSASKKITSVTVHVCNPYGYASEEDQKKIRAMIVKVDDAPANAYRSPTDEELEEFKSSAKEAKAKAKASGKKKPQLVNPTDNDAARLQAIWNDRARKRWERAKEENPYISDFVESEVCRITQAQYSAASKGAYARAETRTLHDGGFPARAASNMWSKSGQDYDQAIGAARCKIRQTHASNAGGSGWYSANRVIVLTDKPQKPLPIDWEAIPEEFETGKLIG